MGIKYLVSAIIILLALLRVSYILYRHVQDEKLRPTNTSLSTFIVTKVIHQKKVSSIPASVSALGLKPQKVVFALPVRDDCKFW